jgi:hypothetical protein
MRFIGSGRTRIVALFAAILLATGIGVAVAANTSSKTPSNAMSAGRGIDEFGMTKSFFKGHSVSFTYTKGFFCDRHVSSAATSKCEAGKKWKHAPKGGHDPLYITVPLGFTEPMSMVDCPAKLVCVDHPARVDMTRLEPALKPLYPQLTDAQLTKALRSFPVPEHDHFITTANGGKAEWWDVRVVGVTSKKVFEQIRAHKSFGYIKHLIRTKNKNVVGPIPTNLFLFFSVQ